MTKRKVEIHFNKNQPLFMSINVMQTFVNTQVRIRSRDMMMNTEHCENIP